MVHTLKISTVPRSGKKPQSGTGFLSDRARRIVADRCTELTGGGLIVVAALIIAAVFSYAPGDPSFNIVTDNDPQNILGLWGAAVADLLLQSVGFAGVLPAVILMVWGIKLLRHKHGPQKKPITRARQLRLLFYMLWGLIFLAMELALLNIPASWPFVSGMGGLIGDMANNSIQMTANRFGVTVETWMLGIVILLPLLAFVIAAMGSTWQEWRAFTKSLAQNLVRVGRLGYTAGSWVTARVKGLEGIHRQAPGFKKVRQKATLYDNGANVSVRFGQGPDDSNVDTEKQSDTLSRTGLVATPEAKTAKSRRAKALAQGKLDLGPSGQYELPSLEYLTEFVPSEQATAIQKDALQQNAIYLGTVLADFGIKGEIVKVRPGPVVTLYELEPAPGTKTSRVIGLADDIARSMSAVSVRIAVVPGRSVIGIEMPNVTREMVSLRELLGSVEFEKTGAKLPLALGKDIGGVPMMVDLARMPHLLIAGTTGSGKSVAMNTMILSLLYSRSPDECRMIMIDPKMLELSVYEGIPHLLTPVVTDPSKAVVALKWTVREMEDRYRAMSQLGVRNVGGYNKRILEARKKGEVLTRKVQTGFDEQGHPVMEEQPLPTEPLPFIVVVVDEMADLMLVAGKDVEAAIQRLAQMARAAGIHLIMATQRPSVDVITGTIKANFPTRISFQVTSKIDSRTILGEQGAEQLLGQGDMLYMAGGGRISRVHGPFVSDEEVEDVVRYLKTQRPPEYIEDVTVEEEVEKNPEFGAKEKACDALYDEAVALVAREGKASTSFIQRHLQIGYNRAARIIEHMEKQGVVSPANRVGRRDVLIGEH